MGVPLCQVSRDQLDEGQDCLLVIPNASNSPNLPSYAVPRTPFITASQCSISASDTGPSDCRMEEGSSALVLSSWRRRFVEGGVGERDGGAITRREYGTVLWSFMYKFKVEKES